MMLDRTDIIDGGCWLWNGHIDKEGYGHFSAGGIHYLVHRLSHLAFIGAIPAGLQVDHLCRVRNCVNPAHLEAVTPRENVFRSDGIAPRNARKTHCPKGHPYSPENTIVQKTGGRACRVCYRASVREGMRRFRAKQKLLRGAA